MKVRGKGEGNVYNGDVMGIGDVVMGQIGYGEFGEEDKWMTGTDGRDEGEGGEEKGD